MKTKIIMFGAIMMLAFAMFASTSVLADNSTLPVPMLTSANPSTDLSNVTDVGSGTIFWRQVGLWFTFNQEKKMNKEMDLAQLKLQQAEFATAHNKTDAAEKALDAYQNLMDSAKKRSEAISSDGNASLAMVKLSAMDQAIAVHQGRIAKLSAFLLNSNLTANQKAKIEARLVQVQNVTAHLQEIQGSKEDKIKTRLMAQGNLTQDQAQKMIDDSKNQAFRAIDGKPRQAINELRGEARAQNLTAKELADQRVQQSRDEARARMANRTAIENRTPMPRPIPIRNISANVTD